VNTQPTSPATADSAKPEKKTAVIEIFGPTIQGEGAMIGVKTMFVRTGGCDYKCEKCDSMHAVDPQAVKQFRTMMTEEEIAKQLFDAKEKTGVEWVTLSGGNPVMWDLTYLIELCHGFGMKVAVETQGTLYRPWVAHCDQITISPKTPGMGEKFEPEKLQKFIHNIAQAQLSAYELWTTDPIMRTSLKVVVFDQLDLDFALHIGEIALNSGVSRDQLYLSIGNPYVPILSQTDSGEFGELAFGDNPIWADVDQPRALLAEYRQRLEEYLQDPRFRSWKLLPQLHVLLYGNEPGV
jgi:7-carboxy-7-deazaguanine synthase